mmetsp:Transcript_45818/g.111568  ORF Transcript_45818/g.111568 Transcript_45818/m.111568 type:complete len:320 (-) Transcript_45818:205-1164(-)
MTLRVVRNILATFTTCRIPSPSVDSGSGSRSGSSHNLVTTREGSPGSPQVSLQKQVSTFSSLVAKETEENAWQVLGSRWRQRAGVYGQIEDGVDDGSSDGPDKVRRFSSRSGTSASVSFRQASDRGSHHEMSRKRPPAFPQSSFSQSSRNLMVGRKPPSSCSRSMTNLPVHAWGSPPTPPAAAALGGPGAAAGGFSVGVQFPTPPRVSSSTLTLKPPPLAMENSLGAVVAPPSAPKSDAAARVAKAKRSNKIDAFFMEEFRRLVVRIDNLGEAQAPGSMDSRRSSLRPGPGDILADLGASHGLLYTDAAHLVLEKPRKK